MIKILLIEDNLIDQMAFSRMLDKEGLEDCELQIVENIGNAEQLLKQKDFQLIVCDMNLPDGTAFDLSHIFKKNTFILLSGHITPELEQEAMESGILKVLPKTSDLSQLSPIIEIIKQKSGTKLHSKQEANPKQSDKQGTLILAHLKATFDNNPIYIIDIIQSFLIENPKLISRLNLAAEIRDIQQIVNTAHQLKSGYMLMGFTELEDIAKEIETNNALNVEDLNDLIHKLINLSAQSYALLKSALAQFEDFSEPKNFK